jgi:carbon monoxide dehydrogenase subunit G
MGVTGMEFEDQVAIDTDTEHLWSLVSDPEVLVECVPGATEVERVSEREYHGVIERGVAGVSLTLDGEVEMTEFDEPDRLSADARGEDRRSNSRMEATMHMDLLEADDGDGTTISYVIDLRFTGRLASLGARIVKRKFDSDIDTFFENITERAEE